MDTMTADRSAPAVDDADLVNGPEDVLGDWDEVEWRRVEQDVRRLRQRIFTASQAGDLKRVRNLQKLMLRSRANTLVSVPGSGLGSSSTMMAALVGLLKEHLALPLCRSQNTRLLISLILSSDMTSQSKEGCRIILRPLSKASISSNLASGP